ncbi:hypothetical protein THOM_2354 [Trachipleistophora hominis]|uniref:Uncharacterized protein n=1 Tax=Trachipleistophora hominis TaxID=72359 RepID=L7JTC9_TRAHO|nr:hypothetical protein THOM_2354 [Trachipleistophora hominis]
MKNLLYLIILIVGVVALVAIIVFVYGYSQAKKYEKKFMEQIEENYNSIQANDSTKDIMSEVKVLLFYKDGANNGRIVVKGVSATGAFKDLKDQNMKKSEDFLKDIKDAENLMNPDDTSAGLAFDADKIPSMSKSQPALSGIGSMFKKFNVFSYNSVIKDLKARIKEIDNTKCPAVMLFIEAESIGASSYLIDDKAKGKFKENSKAKHKTFKSVEHKGKKVTNMLTHYLLKEVLSESGNTED